MCAACNAEPRRTPGAGRAGRGRAGRGVEHPAPVRVAGHQPLVGVLHAAGREPGEPGLDAADGRIVVAVPVLRQPADGAPPAARGRGCGAASGSAAEGPDGTGSAVPQATHERSAAGSPHLPVSASGPDDRPPEPGLVCRHHLHSGVGRLPVPGRDHGLGQPSRAGLAAVEHDGHRLLHRGAGSSASDRHARDLQHRSGGAVYERDVHRAGAGGGRAMLDGRPRAVPGQRLHRTGRSTSGGSCSATPPRSPRCSTGSCITLTSCAASHVETTPEARKCIHYVFGNRHRMRYPQFRAKGLCISSGVVEAGCKQIGARSSAPACAGLSPAPTPSSPCAAASSVAASRTSGNDEPQTPPDGHLTILSCTRYRLTG